jgi:hypothetical protein
MSGISILAGMKALVSGVTTPIYWPSMRVVPPDPPAPFVWVEISGLGGILLGSGSMPLSARNGFSRFHIFIPYGDPLEEAYTIADILTALYAAQANAGGCAGLQILAPTPPEIGAQSDDGLWYGVSISVPWVYWASAGA